MNIFSYISSAVLFQLYNFDTFKFQWNTTLAISAVNDIDTMIISSDEDSLPPFETNKQVCRVCTDDFQCNKLQDMSNHSLYPGFMSESDLY